MFHTVMVVAGWYCEIDKQCITFWDDEVFINGINLPKMYTQNHYNNNQDTCITQYLSHWLSLFNAILPRKFNGSFMNIMQMIGVPISRDYTDFFVVGYSFILALYAIRNHANRMLILIGNKITKDISYCVLEIAVHKK